MASNSTVSITFKMEDVGGGFKKLIVNADNLRKVMAETVKTSQQMQDSIIHFAAFATGVSALANSVGQLSDGLRNLTSESEQFNKAMREANTMAGQDSAGFKKLKGEVAELAKEIPIARDLLAKGLYQTISNGVPEDNWIEFLNTSARSAAGGLADIEKVVGVTSTIIKNYGLEWEAAADIQDKIQLTAKNGVTSFEQLAQALPRVTGNAATLGVTIDELMGTFATLTGVSGNTAEVSTQLAAIFSSLVKPSSEASKMAAEMGIQFDAAAIKAAGGFQNFLKQLDSSIKTYAQATGKLEQEIYGRLFGSAEALRALIPLQGELADKFSSNIASMVDSAGTMDAAFAEIDSTSESRLQRWENRLSSLKDSVYSVVSVMQPLITFSSGILSAAANILITVNGFKQLGIAANFAAVKTKIADSVFKIISRTSKKTALGLEMIAVAEGAAAKQAALLKIALRGLLSLSVIGAAVWGVTAAIDYFSSSADKAADTAAEAKQEFNNWKKSLTDLSNTAEQAAAKELSTLDRLYKAALDESRSKKERIEVAEELKSTYADTFKNLETEAILAGKAAQAYDQLRSSIIEAAKANAAKSKIEENQGENLGLELEKEQLENFLKDNSEKVKALEQQYRQSLDEHRGKVLAYSYAGDNELLKERKEASRKYKETETQFKSLQSEVNKAQSRLAEIKNRQAAIDKANAKLAEYVDPLIPDPIIDPGQNQGNDQKFDTSMGYENFTKLGQYEQYLKELSEKRRHAHSEELHALDELIQKVQAAKKAFENGFRVDDGMRNFDKDGKAINTGGLPLVKLPSLPTQRDLVPTVDISNITEAFDEMKRKAEETAQSMSDSFQNGWNGLKGIAGGINGITNAVAGNGTAWERLTGIVDGAIAVYRSVQSVMQLAGIMSAAYNAIKKNETATVQENTNANLMNAASETMKAHAWMPFVGIGIAAASVAAMVAAMASVPKFADGGIAYGPTLGLFGEYAGASNNPEVVAPLSDLRKLLFNDNDGGGRGDVYIDGNKIIGYIEYKQKFRKRV